MSTLLIMQFFSYFENLVVFRKNLIIYNSNSDSILNRYDVFHLRELAKANLQNNYVEKIKKTDNFSSDSNLQESTNSVGNAKY
jgi:hypothetical protein